MMMDMIKAICKGNLNYDEECDAFFIKGNGFMVQFQDRLSNEYICISKGIVLNKVSTSTWVRIWYGNNLVFNGNYPKYVARQMAINFIKGE